MRRTVMSESIWISVDQCARGRYKRRPRPSSAVDRASQPPDSPNRFTALELCLQRPDNAYTAFDLSWADRTVGKRNDTTTGIGSRARYWYRFIQPMDNLNVVTNTYRVLGAWVVLDCGTYDPKGMRLDLVGRVLGRQKGLQRVPHLQLGEV